ncbi:siderophore-interacting protein [Leucobacter insecticola]|uniref:Siderophore-interacting protein n=1 Tax=Leucobacter insecticola TaxID=2714934 RepID=A0A6G8FGN2_9MICO|nr:siderophore-interacting protein [Leucobacter insecticola]QIM15507.1 siderophore-interacting protein [Leucobacter insecticola]
MTSAPQPSVRKPKPTFTLEVIAQQWLSPSLVRVTFGGEGFALFEDRPETDKYIKLGFTTPAPESHPVTRTYTVRSVDHAARTIDVDFVVHGAEGLAGPWAESARAGEPIVMRGPGGGFRPDPAADRYLFVGDLSAVPAISAALESLNVGANVSVFIEVESEAAIPPMPAPLGVRVEWIVDPEHRTETLANRVREWGKPIDDVQIFAHGERESMKVLRRLVNGEWQLPRQRLSLSGYWARGRTEDRFQQEKREPIGQIFPES